MHLLQDRSRLQDALQYFWFSSIFLIQITATKFLINQVANFGMYHLIDEIASQNVHSKIQCNSIFCVDHGKRTCRTVPTTFSNRRFRKRKHGIDMRPTTKSPTVPKISGACKIIQCGITVAVYGHQAYGFRL